MALFPTGKELCSKQGRVTDLVQTGVSIQVTYDSLRVTQSVALVGPTVTAILIARPSLARPTTYCNIMRSSSYCRFVPTCFGSGFPRDCRSDVMIELLLLTFFRILHSELDF
jgi:hypothetical protein